MKLQKTQSTMIGLDLENYEEINTLGAGSFGVVKLVQDKRT